MPIASNVVLGNDVRIPYPDLVNLYGCEIGDASRIGPFVEIQDRVSIGKQCRISSHSFICSGVRLGDDVFVGHGVTFINDAFPMSVQPDGTPTGPEHWTVGPIRVRRLASIGSGATILPNVTIGEGAMIGAGAVVTRDVPDYAVVVGNPARVVGDCRTRRTPTEP